MKLKFSVLTLCLALGAGFIGRAEVKPASIFGSGMVLQRESPVNIWGTADKGEKVEVSFNGQSVKTKADKNGQWTATLKAMAAGGPYSLHVVGKSSAFLYDDVYVGEVWLCSGQSNMEWLMGRSMNAEKEIAAADYPMIRSFTVDKVISVEPKEQLEGSWRVCSPETVGNFTGVGYYFARKLWQELGVPVGIINSSWGGTNIETWTNRESFEALPANVRREYDPALSESILSSRDSGSNSDSKITPSDPNEYSSLIYNAMINPIVKFRIKGAIWYQGEGNARNAYSYRTLFPAMITGWRDKWGYEFSFYWVQLADFRAEAMTPGDSDWAELREAQTMTLSVPKTGQAVIIDIGEANDIHPRNKHDVGLRLALNALNKDYGFKDVIYSAPVCTSCEIEGDKATLSFDTFGSELVVRNKYGYVEGFAVAGEDRIFHWAKARIEDGNVIVQSEAVKNPVAVRFAWSDNPRANLFNADGLPVGPFRTDEWQGITK